MSAPAVELVTCKQLAELLVKDRNIHEGIWGIFVRFGIHALNVNVEPPGEPQPAMLAPAALVPILEIGIQPFKKPTEFTVDAAEVNPAPKATKRSASKKSAKKMKA